MDDALMNPSVSRNIKITKFLHYNMSKSIYAGINMILRPIGKSRARTFMEKAGIDPYGAWYNFLFRNNAYLFGTYEMEVKAFMRETLPKGGVCIDIGSAIGTHIPYACRLVGPKGIVVAVEPDPRNIEKLENLYRDGWDFIIIEGALWNEEKIMKLNLDPTGFSYVSALKEVKTRLKGAISETDYKVQTHKLNKILEISKRLDQPIDLVKMDIEGSEYKVLTDRTLNLNCVKNMVLELHYPLSSEEYREISYYMRMRGFDIDEITQHTRVIQGFYSHHIFYVRNGN